MHTGLQGTHDFIVTKAHLASSVGSGQVDVLATPMMITAMEYTAAASAAPVLEAGRTTVGTQISVSHIADTPEGMKVHVETELTEISPNGRLLTFQVRAYDEAGLIGEGSHQRAVVDKTRFEAKAAAKNGVSKV